MPATSFLAFFVAMISSSSLSCSARATGRQADRFLRYAVASVPELTRSVGIQLNERVSLQRADEILSSPQSLLI
jgi:hypothetical protein